MTKRDKGPGRNDPCPCGSGKKSKKCCGPLNARVQALGQLDFSCVSELLDSAHGELGEAFLTPILEGLPWNYEDHAYDRLTFPLVAYHAQAPDGVALPEWALERFGDDFVPEARSWLEAQREARIGVWEVLAVDPRGVAQVRDVVSDEVFEVHEPVEDSDLRPGQHVCARLAGMDGLALFCGLHPLGLEAEHAQPVIDVLAARRNASGSVALDSAAAFEVFAAWETATQD
ncbi:MAG: SEC-C metal-binding domain-containing protein [Planctomycetota bacterium]